MDRHKADAAKQATWRSSGERPTRPQWPKRPHPFYKVQPDTPISWREVGIGALITAVLFTIGKSLIGWYLGTTAASSGYGAAGALVLILLWAYYCAQIFLFGAELTRAIAGRSAQPAASAGRL